MRYLIILIISVVTFGSVLAQKPNDARNRIREEKVAFFNKRLNLSQTEAQKFWPLYNDFQSRKKRISNEKRTLMRYYSENSTNMNDEEITETLNKYIAYEKRETELLVTYNEKFRSILSDEKVLKIYISEVQFKDYLLKKLKAE